MRRSLSVLVCVAALFTCAGAMILADSPPPTEEQIEAQLKEARKRLEAAQAEERALQKRLEEAKAQARGQIKAEVIGVLGWRDDGGYYVRVRPKSDPKREIRVALMVTEDKILVRQLEGLKGMDVVVKGELLQNADGALSISGFDVQPIPHK